MFPCCLIQRKLRTEKELRASPPLVFVLPFLVLLAFLSACSGSLETGLITAVGDNSSSGTVTENSKPSFMKGIEVVEAPRALCPNGGQSILVFKDENFDGSQQDNEEVLSIRSICNGANGADGTNGVDGQNGIDGEDGMNGLDGEDGKDGIDGTDGANGQDAQFYMGQVGPSIAGKFYSACHHDYLYLPNTSDPARSWLIFRHQGNGSYDEGIGSTGFQIWNVDISQFALASEVGNKTYCTLEYNAQNATLSYTVIDSSDGLQGSSGIIQLNQ